MVNNSQLKQLFTPILSEVGDVWTRDIFRDVFSNHANELATPQDYVNHSLYFEAKTFLHGLLVVEDKLSMAHSLETRVPFLDNDLVNFAMACPASLKVRNLKAVERVNENDLRSKKEAANAKSNDGKLLLRDVMSGIIPKSISDGTKQGFSSPDASWFKGESIDFVTKTLSNRDSRIYNFLDFETTQELLKEHLQGVNNRRLLIWSLLNFNEIA
jgi:asparagine synthase (glutamine-hydrolysing)